MKKYAFKVAYLGHDYYGFEMNDTKLKTVEL